MSILESMKEDQRKNFDRIETAIHYIQTHFQEQPNLDVLAEQLQLSPFHFQRLFSEWAGVSPKKFLQFTTLAFAKKRLKEERATLLDTAFDSGLSGTSRLHDLFVKIEGMTPGEYKNGGEQLNIHFEITDSMFGRILCASTEKGICHLTFSDTDDETAIRDMKLLFPNAKYNQSISPHQESVLDLFLKQRSHLSQIKLHLKGTQFQIKVWEALLKIPTGNLASYGSLAKSMDQPNASRAVGSAIGDNPIAYLIPCHRVIRSTGEFGQYRWGSNRKIAMIGWEASQIDSGN